MRTFEEIKTLIEVGLGRRPCDRKLAGVQLVNVWSGEIYETDIYIYGKRVVSIDPEAKLEAKETVDCHGLFALPGLVDTHMHFETTMLSPEALATVVALAVTIVVWCVCGFGLAGLDIQLFHTPIWVIGGTIGTWICSIVVVVVLAKRFFDKT